MDSAVWKALYNFKIKRAQEARHYQFFFQNLQNLRSLRSLKCLKATVKLTFTTSQRLYSLDCLFCFRLELPFLGKFVAKTQNYQFKLKFCTKTNSKMQSSIVIFTFLFSTGNTSLDKFGPKNQNFQSELKFCTRLIWICRIM